MDDLAGASSLPASDTGTLAALHVMIPDAGPGIAHVLDAMGLGGHGYVLRRGVYVTLADDLWAFRILSLHQPLCKQCRT